MPDEPGRDVGQRPHVDRQQRADHEQRHQGDDRHPFRSHRRVPSARRRRARVIGLTCWLSGLANSPTGQSVNRLGAMTSTSAGPAFPGRLARTRLYEQVAEQITAWIAENGLQRRRPDPARARAGHPAGRQPGHAEPGPGRARGDRRGRGAPRRRHRRDPARRRPRIVEAIRAHADRLPEIIDTRDALETKLAALAAQPAYRRGPARASTRRWPAMAADIEAGGRGVEGDERFHGAVTAAAHSLLLARLMDEISELIRETRHRVALPARPPARLAGRAPRHRRGDPRRGPRAPPRPRCTTTWRWSATSRCCATRAG